MEKKQIHVPDQLDDRMERLSNKHYYGKPSLRLVSLRVAIVVFLLVICAGFDLGLSRQHAYAKSTCGILFTCPTPTPIPPTATPPPQPTPIPTPAPTSAPPVQPTPTAASGPVVAPTAPANVPPTPITTAPVLPTVPATATRNAQPTPSAAPTRVPVTNHQKPDDRAPSQPQESGFPHMLMIIALVFCVLLSILGIGLLIFRRMLLPPIQIKPPTVGVGGSSWTRTLAPDPSFNGLDISNNGIQNAPTVNSIVPPLANIDHDGATIANTAIPLMPDAQADTAGVSAANAETTGKLAAARSNTAWYDISDEPFTT